MSNNSAATAVLIGTGPRRAAPVGDLTTGESLRVSVAWTFLGNVVYAVCQWGVLVAAAKLGTPQMLGQFALGLAVTAPLIMLSNLQLRAVQATDAKHAFSFGQYLAMRLLTTFLAFLLIVAIATLGPYRGETAAILVAVGLAKAIESISDVYYGLLQNREQMARIAQSMMLKGSVSVVVFALGMRHFGGVLGGASAMALSLAIVLVTFDMRIGARVLAANPGTGNAEGPTPAWNLAPLRRLFYVSAPLGIVMMLISLNANIPRYFVERQLGEAELGIFAAVGYLMVAGTTVINALGQSASPRMARYYATGDRRAFTVLIRKLMLAGVVLGAAGAFVAFVFGPQILSVVYQPSYATAADVFGWTMLAGAVIYAASFCGYGITAARRFGVQVPLSLVATAATAVASYLLIPRFGLVGAAWALGISATVQLIGAAAVLRTAVAMISPCSQP